MSKRIEIRNIVFVILLAITTQSLYAVQGCTQKHKNETPIDLNQSADNLANDIEGLLKKKNFQDADKVFSHLFQKKIMTDDGSRILETVYDMLSNSNMDLSLLNEWVQETDNHFAYIVRGMTFLEEAWKERGVYFAYTVTPVKRAKMLRNVESAKRDFLNAHQLFPDDPNAAAGMIKVALLSNSKPDEMEKWFQEAIKADPLAYNAYLNKMDYLSPWWHGTNMQFQEFAIWCLNNSPDGSRVYTIAIEFIFSLSTRVSNKKRFFSDPQINSLASIAFKRWKADFPNSVALLKVQGSYQAGMGNYKEAVTYYNKALTLDPRRLSALRARADILFEHIDDGERAKLDYLTILDLNPNSSWALFRLGGIEHYFLKNYTDAESYYTRAIEKDSGNVWYYWHRGKARIRLKRHKDAIEDFSSAIEIDVKHLESYKSRAKLRMVSKDLEGAISDFSAVVEINPNDAEAFYYRGKINYQLGNLSQAKIDLQKSKNLNPGNVRATKSINNLIRRINEQE